MALFTRPAVFFLPPLDDGTLPPWFVITPGNLSSPTNWLTDDARLNPPTSFNTPTAIDSVVIPTSSVSAFGTLDADLILIFDSVRYTGSSDPWRSDPGGTAFFDHANIRTNKFFVASSSTSTSQWGMVDNFGGRNNATLKNGTQLTAQLIEVGSNVGDVGTLTVSGSGTQIKGNPTIRIGVNGTAGFVVDDQATVAADSVDVAIQSQSGITDVLSVNNATLSVIQAIRIGYVGVANATFSNNAHVSAAELDLGFMSNSNGTLSITSGSSVDVTGAFNVGSASGAFGHLVLDDATITANTLSVSATGVIEGGGYIHAKLVNSGQVNVKGFSLEIVGDVSGAGSFLIDSSGKLIIDGDVVGVKTTIGANSTMELKGTDSGAINFSGTGGILQIDTAEMPSGLITGLSGNKIHLETVSLASLKGKTAAWSGDQLSIASSSFNLAGGKKDIAFFSDAQGHAEFTTTDFGVDGTKEAGIVLDATQTLLQSIVAIKSFQKGSLALTEFNKVFSPFFTGLSVTAEAAAVYQKFQTVAESPTATPEDIEKAWHDGFSEAVHIGVKQGLKVLIAEVAAAAAAQATTGALVGLAGFAAEGAVGGYVSALAIGAGVISVPVVVGLGAALAVGIVVDQYYEPVLGPLVSNWIREVSPWVDDFVGIAVDGYLSGATVFSDDNGNGQLDPSEASTTTDATGSFSLSGGIGPLLVFGGIDTSTGLHFKGQLSAPSGSTIVSPLTTLLTELGSDPLAEQKILASFGLSSSLDLTTFDPIAATQSGGADGAAALIAVAKLYDTASLIASALVAGGEEFSTVVDRAFAAIAAAVGGAGISLTSQASVSALIAQLAQSEGIVLGAGVADSVAAIIVASNTLLDEKFENGVVGDLLLNNVAAIQTVSLGKTSDAIQHAGNDPIQLLALVNAFTGDTLDNAVFTALSHLGGSETLLATSANDVFDGGGGHYTVVYPGVRSEYTLTASGNGTLTVADLHFLRGGTDTLTNINYLEFSDKLIVVADANEASIARLYSAALNRMPDKPGLNGWEDIYANNISSAAKAAGVYVSLAQTDDGFGTSIAGGFGLSIEFQTKYGNLDDGGFVSQLYLNVLGRAPAIAERDAWLDLMHNNGFTRDMVLVGFAESPENIAKTAADWLIQI